MFGADTRPRTGTDEFLAQEACSDAFRKKLTLQSKCVGSSKRNPKSEPLKGTEKIIPKTAEGHYTP